MLKFNFSTIEEYTAKFEKKQVEDSLLDHFSDCVQAYTQKIETFENDAKDDEESYKRTLETFLNDAFYKGKNAIDNQPYAQGSGTDLAIFHGLDRAKSNIAVLIEVKTPQNKAEMMTLESPNKKAIHEAVHYYLWEKIEKGNDEITHLVITNCIHFFVFRAEQFRKIFFDDGKLKKHFQEWRKGKKDDDRTKQMYQKIKQFVEESEEEINGVHFSLTSLLLSVSSQTTLLSLYRFFAPYSLLKEDIIFDANALNKPFYYELLYILGLEEYRDGEVVKIRRKKQPESGALMELIIFELSINGRIDNPALEEYGKDRAERIENVALALCILWLNRILFLKLLEAQLFTFNDSDKRFKFMNLETLPDFSEIKGFFFAVLARRPEERHPMYQERFAHIPYLNSSLFEPDRTLEEKAMHIAELKNNVMLPIYQDTILRDGQGKLRKGEKIRTLPYLFDFLNVYSFGLVGEHIVNPASNTIINASVLGKIFEKLNGYADGSFFTPSYITEYMCRELLHTCVLKKCSKAFGFQFDSIKELDTYIFKNKKQKQANELINSLKICDPAVGSGHFLVSMLNQVLFLKYELGILYERNTDKLLRVSLKLENDEVIIGDDEYGEKIDYKLKGGKLPLRAQIVQETLFHEKQTIIENCLFGVDINPNSVKICQLRLWIELLKNAYYKAETLSKMQTFQKFASFHHLQLETLPNIDINIKTGNSVLSRFELGTDLRNGFKKSINWNFKYYLECVNGYKKELNKENKRAFEQQIDFIKGDIKTKIRQSDPLVKEYTKLGTELYELTTQKLFDNSLTDKQKIEKENQIHSLTAKVEDLKIRIDSQSSGETFRRFFEWRFEFPEILDETGDFIGFDIVVGNPPYISHDHISYRDNLKSKYTVHQSFADLFCYFFELGFNIVKENGQVGFITSNSFLKAEYGKPVREFLTQRATIQQVINIEETQVFEEAVVNTAITSFQKNKTMDNILVVNAKYDEKTNFDEFVKLHQFFYAQEDLGSQNWNLISKEKLNLLNQLSRKFPSLEQLNCQINLGVATGANDVFIIDESKKAELINQDSNNEKIIKPILRGRDIQKYIYDFANLYIILTRNEINVEKEYPTLYQYFDSFGEKFKQRGAQGRHWTNLRAASFFDDFKLEKIVWIELSDKGRFALCSDEMYLLNSAYFLIPPKVLDSKYLLGILNSKLIAFYLKSTANTSGMGTTRWINIYVKNFPIPIVDKKIQQAIIFQVDQILTLKKTDKEADTSAIEQEIDRLVYALYGLSAQEIDLIETNP